ncbi:MAG TPA: hypothetical protein VM221_00640 [Armatimonadota bacterium]|nr:hypothetical protein [Armatimonadota bacterium]
MPSPPEEETSSAQPKRRVGRLAVASLVLAVASVSSWWLVWPTFAAWLALLDRGWVQRLPALVHIRVAAGFLVFGFFPLLSLVLGAVALDLTWTWTWRPRAQRRWDIVAGLGMAISGALALVITGAPELGLPVRIGIMAGLAIILQLRRLDSLSVAAISVPLGALSLISAWPLSWRLALAVSAFMPAVGVLTARRSRRPLLAALVATSAAVAALFGGLPGTWARATTMADGAWCAGNMKGLALYAIWYAQDHDGRLPDADKWCDQLLPYVGVVAEVGAIGRRPRLRFTCLRALGRRSGYAFNRALSGVRLSDIPEQDQFNAALLFESDLGWNGAGDISDLAVPPRHNGISFIAFADGHVKAVALAEARELIWQPLYLSHSFGTRVGREKTPGLVPSPG